MLKNLLTIALRNLWRRKLHMAINVAGLAIGISACLVIYLIVKHELNYESFRADRDRICRVYSAFSGTFQSVNRGVAAAVPAFVRENLSGIEAATNFLIFSSETMIPQASGAPRDMGMQKEVVIADPQFFQVFSDVRWISGSPKQSLGEPYQVVLTESKARLYFGEGDPQQALGRQVTYRDSLTMTVSGLIADPEGLTDLAFGDFISLATIRNSGLKTDYNLDDWTSTNSSTQLFVKTAPGVDQAKVAGQLKLVDRQYAEMDKNRDWVVNFRLQPLSDLHYNPELGIFDSSSAAPAHRPTLYALILVAVLLLLIAAVNFVNLETAQSTRRAREVGVRKVLGSSRTNLVAQFLGETMVVTFIAVLISVQIAYWALKYFDEFIPEGVALNITDPFTLGFLLATLALVSLLAGFYPSFVLSSYMPVLALKDQALAAGGRTRSVNLRRGLIVFQFVISQLLIFGTFTIGRQIGFMLNKDMGFDKDAIVYFYTPWRDTTNNRFVLQRELLQLPEISALSLNDSPPAENGYSTTILKYENGKETLSHNVHRKFGDTAFIHLYEIPLVAGRNLMPSDSVREFLINETYARRLGFDDPSQAIQQELIYQDKTYPIVGVVKDFHIQSLHTAIEPVFIANDPSDFSCFGLKLHALGKGPGDFAAFIDKVKMIWEKLYPDDAFEFQFLDETVASFYETEQRTAKLMRTATGVAVLISCLGLLGLISYTATQRTREIGIRKVMGATVFNVVSLLTRDFLILVAVACLIAFPLAWYLTDRWLQDFAYRIEIEWWTFLVAGLAAVGLALFTISFRAVRAALANPADSLKYE